MPHRAAFLVESFFDADTRSLAYLVYDPAGRRAALVDTVLGADGSAAALAERVRALALEVDWILETHVHAGHRSAAAWLRQRLGGRVATGSRVVEVQQTQSCRWGLPLRPVFDLVFGDGARLDIGAVPARVLHTPGHTPGCVSYLVGDELDGRSAAACFVGDALAMPDVGTARCDFPGSDARTLFQSVNKLLALPATTRLFVGHDLPPPGRPPRCEATVAEQRERNVHVRDGIPEEAFVTLRRRCDAALPPRPPLEEALRANLGAVTLVDSAG